MRLSVVNALAREYFLPVFFNPCRSCLGLFRLSEVKRVASLAAGGEFIKRGFEIRIAVKSGGKLAG